MTLIAFTTSDDSATICTDSIAYSKDGRWTGTSDTKTAHLPTVAGAMVFWGNQAFRDVWRPVAEQIAADAADFDVFTAAAEPLLPAAYERMRQAIAENGAAPDVGIDEQAECAVFHLGYSPAAGRFVAYAYDSHLTFERREQDGLFAVPAPTGHAINPIELVRAWRSVEAADHDPDQLKHWYFADPMPAPTTAADWIDLAKTCHRSRSLDCTADSGLKVAIGGDVHLATLTHDGLTTEQIHTFDDPDEFAQMVTGTLHPIGQTQPCPCGNGKTLIDCILANGAGDELCVCGSDRPFGECCSVYATEAESTKAYANA